MEFIVKAREHIEHLEKRVKQLEEESLQKDEILRKLLAGESGPSEPILPTAELFIEILDDVSEALSSDDMLNKAKSAVAATEQALEGVSKDEGVRFKIRAADNVVRDEVSKIWSAKGLDADEGVEQAKSMLSDLSLSEETRDRLEEALLSLNEVEERVVVIAAMGQDEYQRQQQDMADMTAAGREVQQTLMSTTDTASRNAYVMKVNNDAKAIMATKLAGAKSRAQMDELFGSLTPEERLTVFKAQALSQMLGIGGGGSHSHNGQPCHGHGAPPPQQHTHSHDGQPCHGHGAPAPQQHTHSHGGEPCGGHGHSHGEEEEEDDYYEEDDCDEEDAHDHSHDHGHSHDHHGHSHDHGHGH
jgi:hypothetical protein